MILPLEKGIWLHFLPAGLFFGINVTVEIIGANKLGESFSQLFFLVSSIIIFIQMYAYLFLKVRLIVFYKKSINQELSYIPPPINYLVTIISNVGFCTTLFFVDFSADVYGFGMSLTYMDYNIAWISISLLTFVLAYYAMVRPELFRITPIKESSNVIDESELHEIKNELIHQMKGQKLYLNPELSLIAIANRLGRRKEVISKVINQGLNKNFYQFVNEYRIEEFKQLVEQEEKKHITHLGLAFEAGFNSKTTFYKAFKEIAGVTPSQYLKAF